MHSEQTLRAQLTEFRDHKLIRSKKVMFIYLSAYLWTEGSYVVSPQPFLVCFGRDTSSPTLTTAAARLVLLLGHTHTFMESILLINNKI